LRLLRRFWRTINEIVGGFFDDNKPPDPLVNLIFGNDNATQEVYVARLQPGQYITFRNITQTFDTCGVGLTIDVPIGAIAAIALEGSPYLAAAAILPNFIVTWDPSSIQIGGSQ